MSDAVTGAAEPPASSESDSVTVYLGVGSNVDAERNLQLAWRQLARLGDGLVASRVYRNAPVGFEGDDFFNLVVRMRTALNPGALLAALEHIHTLAGRKRGSHKFAPRELDIDLLLYGDVVSADWKLPRADIVEYAFVAQPMAELAPELRHPVTGQAMHELWRDMRDGAPAMQRIEMHFEAPGG